jgi:spermidine synthase
MTTLSETHRRHITALRESPAVADEEGLRLGAQFVMFFAEADLMREHAVRLTSGLTGAHVLEIGLGLAVFAEQLAALNVASYTAIEPHPGVIQVARQRVLDRLPFPVTVIPEPWQVASVPAGAFDAIMYDTWPPDGHADSDFADFVQGVALPALRPGGRFSFFHSGTALNVARSAVLDQHFASWTVDRYEMPAGAVPLHWAKPTRQFLIPIAVKGAT